MMRAALGRPGSLQADAIEPSDRHPVSSVEKCLTAEEKGDDSSDDLQ
jgi:hypothetical protein